MTYRSRVLCALVSSCVMAVVSHAAGQAEPVECRQPKVYEAHVDEGVAHFNAARFAEASERFQAALEVCATPEVHQFLGQAAFEMEDFMAASRHLDAALQEGWPPDPEVRARVEGWLAKARAELGACHLALRSDAGRLQRDAVELRVDGTPVALPQAGPLWLAPGTHRLSADAVGHDRAEVLVEVAAGDERRVDLILRPSATQRPDVSVATAPAPTPASPHGSGEPMAWAGVPVWMWLAGGAVLSAGSAVAFWQVGEARYEDLRRECASGCTQAEKEASGVRTWDVLTNVSLGLSAALVAGSVAVFVLGSEREKPSPEVSVGVAPGGLQLRGHF